MITINNHNIISKLVFTYFIVGKFWGNQYSFTLVLVVILTLITTSSATIQKSRETVDRINYGTIFQREQDLLISREFWLHTFHIPLPKRFKVSKIPSCDVKYNCTEPQCNIVYNCQMLHTLVTQIHSLHESVFSSFNHTMRNIRNLIPQSKKFSFDRVTRSLLPFVGKMYKGLFGLATMEDVEIMASHINAITRRTNGLVKAFEQHNKHLSSFISVTDKRMTNLMNGIKLNNKEIVNMVNVMNFKFKDFENTVLNISSIILKQVDKANVLRSKFSNLEQAVQNLVDGRLTPYLIDSSTLTSVLHSINSKLRRSYKQFFLIHTDPNYYYSNANFVYARNHSSLYVTLKFPISSLRQPLKLYKVVSLPVPVKDTTSSDMHATQLLSLPDYFAITPHHDYYLPLSSSDLLNCQHDSIILCDINLVLTPITFPDCTMALFANDRNQIKKSCDFRFTQKLLKSQIIELTATSALVYNSKNLILDCPKEQQIVPGCAFCIIHVPCRCSVSTSTLYFSPRLVNCYNTSVAMTIVHPVNLALLQEFFDDSKLMSIFGDTTFPSPINLSVPEFQIYNHSFSEVIAKDQKDHLSLKKIATAVKKDQKVFQSLAEPLVDGLIDISPDWPDLNAWLAISSLGVAIVAICASAYMFFKMRKMSVALLVLQQVQNVSSQTLPSFIYKVETEKDEDSDNTVELLTSEFSWVHASIIIGVLVMCIMTIVLVVLYKIKSKKGTFLALELTSGGSCVMVPLMSLSLCPSYYKINRPVIRDIAISSFPTRNLIGTWSKFLVTDRRTGKSFSVPHVISLSLFQYFAIKRILSQPFSAYVVLIHHNYAFPLGDRKDVFLHENELDLLT